MSQKLPQGLPFNCNGPAPAVRPPMPPAPPKVASEADTPAGYRATVSMLLAHAKPATKVSHEEVLEIAAMHPDELRRRAVVARDWHRRFAECLDGLPTLKPLGAPPNGCWLPRDIRRVVEQLLARLEAQTK